MNATILGEILFKLLLVGCWLLWKATLTLARGAAQLTTAVLPPAQSSGSAVGRAALVGAVWAGALMLDHLGERDAHDLVMSAIEGVLAEGSVRPADLGGRATTEETASAIRARM